MMCIKRGLIVFNAKWKRIIYIPRQFNSTPSSYSVVCITSVEKLLVWILSSILHGSQEFKVIDDKK